MTRKFDMVAIGTGSGRRRRPISVARLDGRWQWSIRGRSAVRVRCADAILKKYWWGPQK